MKHTLIYIASITALATAAMAVPFRSCAAGAHVGSHIETFDSLSVVDTLATTAWWDTASGHLRLPPFELEYFGGDPACDFAMNVVVAGNYAYVSMNADGMRVYDITDPSNPALVDTIVTTEQVREIVIRGDYAYFANNFAGLAVIDISDPTDLKFISIFPTNGQTPGLDVRGNYAYLADGPAGVTVMDITDPAFPQQLGQADTPGYAQHVRVSGNYAYVADWWSGLQVVDISDPNNPFIVGSYDTDGLARGIAVSGHYVYMVDGAGNVPSGLHIIDVSDPTMPTPISFAVTPGLARGIHLDGDFAYVADHADGLHVFDIGDRGDPTWVSSYTKPGYCHTSFVAGNIAFVAGGSTGFHTFRIADQLTQTTAQGSTVFARNENGLARDGHRLYSADGSGGVSIVDVTDPALPVAIAGYDQSGSLGYVNDVDVDGEFLFIARETGITFEVVNVRDPLSPVSLGSAGFCDPCAEIEVDGDLAFTIEGATFQVVNLDTMSAPKLVGSLNMTGPGNHIVATGDYAFVARSDSAAVCVINVIDESNPQLIASFNVGSGSIANIAHDGDILYLIDDLNSLLRVVSIADIMEPVEITSVAIAGARHVSVSGDFAFVTSTTGVSRYNISDPALPMLIDSHPLGNSYSSIPYGDMILVEGQGVSSVQVFQRRVGQAIATAATVDLSPSAESAIRARLSSIEFDSVSWEVTADGGANWTVAVADNAWVEVPSGDDIRWRATLTYDESTGSLNPRVDEVTMEWLFDFPVIESVADVPDDGGGKLTVWWRRSGHDFVGATDMTDSYVVYRRDSWGAVWDSLVVVPAIQHQRYGTTVATEADDIFTAYRIEARTGLSTYVSPADSGMSTGGGSNEDLPLAADAGPRGYELSQNAPNPFNPSTRISFHLAMAGPVRVDVFDVRGRLVRRLVDGALPVGGHSVQWDGRNRSGLSVASGVYFYRMQVGGFSQTRKMILVE